MTRVGLAASVRLPERLDVALAEPELVPVRDMITDGVTVPDRKRLNVGDIVKLRVSVTLPVNRDEDV